MADSLYLFSESTSFVNMGKSLNFTYGSGFVNTTLAQETLIVASNVIHQQDFGLGFNMSESMTNGTNDGWLYNKCPQMRSNKKHC